MPPETTIVTTRTKFSGHAEGRAIVDRARVLRAAVLRGMLRAVWARVGPRRGAAGTPTRA